MIKVEVETKDYWKCNACLSDVSLKRVIIIPNEHNHTSSFRLCSECRKVMREVLKDEDND